jgi:hypothetical protein
MDSAVQHINSAEIASLHQCIHESGLLACLANGGGGDAGCESAWYMISRNADIRIEYNVTGNVHII